MLEDIPSALDGSQNPEGLEMFGASLQFAETFLGLVSKLLEPGIWFVNIRSYTLLDCTVVFNCVNASVPSWVRRDCFSLSALGLFKSGLVLSWDPALEDAFYCSGSNLNSDASKHWWRKCTSHQVSGLALACSLCGRVPALRRSCFENRRQGVKHVGLLVKQAYLWKA